MDLTSSSEEEVSINYQLSGSTAGMEKPILQPRAKRYGYKQDLYGDLDKQDHRDESSSTFLQGKWVTPHFGH